MTRSTNPLFHFGLWPLREVLPWGDPVAAGGSGRRIHWFGLTDGWYGMDCGGTELLRYNAELIASTSRSDKGPGAWTWRTPFFEYQVARYYEDLLDILPFILNPVPADLAVLVQTPSLGHAFEACADAWYDAHTPPGDESSAESDAAFELWERAAGWWSHGRCLSAGHVAGQPEIRFWSDGDAMRIWWVNDRRPEPTTCIPWNSVADGAYELPIADFLAEIRGFHDRLMSAMAERVRQAPEVFTELECPEDLPRLAVDHAERTRWLDEALARSEAMRPDWDDVRTALVTMHQTRR